MHYLRDPKAIYTQSFAIIDREADLSTFCEQSRNVARRIIHACGMPEIAPDLRISEGFAASTRSAIGNGAPILTDAELVRHGIIQSALPKAVRIICTLHDKDTLELSRSVGTTRAAAAVELWREHLANAVVIIGNAPTALFALLDLLDRGVPRPAAIAAFPVGFVGAAESKSELVSDSRGVPYATLLGRKGGSAMAAAAINALFAGD